MAATKATPGSAILLAALAIPGLVQAENAPEQASISVKYLDYQDSQPGLDRIGVRSPSIEILVPIAGQWAVRAGLVSDVISGASPRYHTAISGASRFSEKRTGVDAAVSRYFPRSSFTLAAGRSGENDYVSRFVSTQASFSSEDNNTTWLFGAGVANDRINPVNNAAKGEHKRVLDLLFGVTRVLTPRDVAQVVLTLARGRGYYSNPYKYVDSRPREQDQQRLLVRWNHHLDESEAATRLSYRYYRDSFGVHAHTTQGEYVRPFANGWTLTPSLRLHTQSAASFYFGPVYDQAFGPPFPPGFDFTVQRAMTADQRMSAFGAITLGLKLEKQIAANTTIDFKWEQYQQRASWRVFGDGSPGLDPFSARSLQLGVTHRW